MKWTGSWTAKTQKGKAISGGAEVEAPDSYIATDLIKASAEKRHGELYFFVVKFNRGVKLGSQSISARAARNAGEETDDARIQVHDHRQIPNTRRTA